MANQTTGTVMGLNPDGSYRVQLTQASSPLLTRVGSLSLARMPVGQQVLLTNTKGRDWDFRIWGPTQFAAARIPDTATTTIRVEDSGSRLLFSALVAIQRLDGSNVFRGRTNLLGTITANVLPGAYRILATDRQGLTVQVIEEFPQDLIVVRIGQRCCEFVGGIGFTANRANRVRIKGFNFADQKGLLPIVPPLFGIRLPFQDPNEIGLKPLDPDLLRDAADV